MPPGGAADDAKGQCFLGATGKEQEREGREAAGQQGLAGFDGMLKTNPLVICAACAC